MDGPVTSLISIMGNRLLFNLRSQHAKTSEGAISNSAICISRSGELTTIRFQHGELIDA